MKRTLLLLLIIPFISCSLFNNENDGYEQALEQWNETKSNDYEFTFNVGCFCPAYTPARIIVQADTVYKILNPGTEDSLMVQTGENTFQYAGDVYSESYKTIDELFDVIINARKQNATKIDVKYNSTIGYPESISIDYIKDAIDDEVGYSVSNYISRKIGPN